MATIHKCLVCKNENLFPYLDLGEQPLANSYRKDPSQTLNLPRYRLATQYCPLCTHSQLTYSPPPEDQFDDYLYVSGTSKTLDTHFEELTKEALEMLTLHRVFSGDSSLPRLKKPRVLEIACNDGSLLEKFKNRGCEVLGVDPALNLKPYQEARGVGVIQNYWGRWMGDEVPESDLVIAVNVLPHVEDPIDFLLGCWEAVSKDGLVIIQTSQCGMFRNHEFDAIYHEHRSFFTAQSLTMAAERAHFQVVGIKELDIHSKSFRMYLKPLVNGAEPEPCDEALTLIEKEMELGMDSRLFYADWAKQVQSNIRELEELCASLQSSGKKLVAYGASAKGNTLYNASTVSPDYIVDDNPLKHDYYTPGKSIIIRSPEALKEEGPLAILMTAWNFQPEIEAKLRELGRQGDTLIRYVPHVETTVL